MAGENTQNTNAKTIKELTEDIRLLNDENKSLRQNCQAMGEV